MNAGIFRISQFNLIGLSLYALFFVFMPTASAQTEANFNNIIIEQDILIRMRDGVNIAVDVYRPTEPGLYPALYASGPFPHASQSIPDNSYTGPVAWYVNQGYAYVLASTRGTGLSEGQFEFLARDEQQDHYEIIEWIAEQEWSNGTIAGAGSSYYATSQWLMAIQNPPHLSCIAPFNGVPDTYRDWAYPGGLASSAFTQDWYDQQVRISNAFPESGSGKLVEYDLRLQQLLHPSYDDYWRLRSSIENIGEISIPVFIMHSWNPTQPGLVSTLRAMELINSVNKILLFGDSAGEQLYRSPEFHQQELLAFYAWCLSDQSDSSINTSFIERPRIRYFVRGQDQIKRESSWPPGNTQATALYLNPLVSEETESESGDEGSLSFERLSNNTRRSEYGIGTGSNSVRFVSEILDQDLEITGPLMMELYVASTASDTAFEVTVSEQIIHRQINYDEILLPSFLNPDVNPKLNMNLLTAATSAVVSSGRLKASTRSTDDTLSLASQPYYSFAEPALLDPGRVYLLEIQLQPTAYRFRRGNRIVLEIRKVIDGSLANLPSQDSLYHSAQYPSRLWLPVVQSLSGPGLNSESAGVNDAFILPTADIETENSDIPILDFFRRDDLLGDDESPIIFIPQ